MRTEDPVKKGRYRSIQSRQDKRIPGAWLRPFHWPVGVCVCLVNILPLADIARALDISGDASLIDEVCVANEANLAKLKTWVADIEVRDKIKSPLKLEEWKDDVSIAFDRDLPAYDFRWRCIESNSTEDGNAWLDRCEMAELVADGNVHRIPVFDPRTQKMPAILTGVPEKTKSVGLFERRIVPIELFWYRGSPVSEYILRLANMARKYPDQRNVEVSREGSLVKIVAAPQGNREEIVVDLVRGGMLVFGVQRVKRYEQSVKVEVASQNGVWVPSAVHRHRVDFADDGSDQQVHDREMTWKTNIVNAEIPRSHFTIDAFREGRAAVVMDRGTLDAAVVSTLEPVRRDPAAAPAFVPGHIWRVVGYTAAALLPLGLIALLAWRRLRRQESRP